MKLKNKRPASCNGTCMYYTPSTCVFYGHSTCMGDGHSTCIMAERCMLGEIVRVGSGGEAPWESRGMGGAGSQLSESL